MLKKSNIEEIDFIRLYQEQHEKSFFKSKTKDEWNKKADEFNKKSSGSVYNEEFVKRVNFTKSDTFLDVGCGSGNLTLCFAKTASFVHSLDFSPKMLEILRENADKDGLKNIKTHELSWNDNWDSVPSADIVIASRSMEVDDIKDALLKLHKKAKKRVYLTYKVGGSFVDKNSLNIIKKDINPKPDYIYIVNALYQLGINASVDFIQSEGRGAFLSLADDYVKSIEWSLGELNHNEKMDLKNYFDSLSNEEKKYLNEAYQWAFIYWEKNE